MSKEISYCVVCMSDKSICSIDIFHSFEKACDFLKKDYADTVEETLDIKYQRYDTRYAIIETFDGYVYEWTVEFGTIR